jgi:hypothetical protein
MVYVEEIESRTLLSVSLGSDGWTSFGKSSDTHVIYVSSSSGKDSNTGLSQNSPVKSLSKARSLMRDGKPDWLLLKRGDTFTGGFGPWKTSGRSSTEMQLIGTYGSGNRPIINSGTMEGFVTFGGSGHAINNVAITGLQFFANSYNGKNGSFSTTGIRLTRQGNNWLIEDCRIQGYKDNITLDGDGSGINGLKIRRCEIVDAYCASSSVGNGHAQGIYLASGTKNVTIEQNVIDHNGWKEGVSGAGATMFNHDIYVNSGVSGTVIKDNIISRASLCGITIRSGGTIQNNLILRSPVGVKAEKTSNLNITGNVILDGTDLAGTAGGATGIDAASVSSLTISNNIIAREQSSAKYHVTGIRIGGGVKNATISSNVIYKWQQSINLASGLSNITVKNNQLQNTDTVAPLIAQVGSANTGQYHYSGNIYGTPRKGVNSLNNSDKTLSQWISATKETGAKAQTLKFRDPNRDVSSTLISSARSLSKTSWSNTVTATTLVKYIKDGFALV